jgi:hypothetical protein
VSDDPAPGLDRLITALTAPGHPDELTSRDKARAAFRSAWYPGGDNRAGPRRRPHRPRRTRLPGSLRPRLAVLAAAVAVVAGTATAAYTRVLPGPAQDAAHSVLAPLGVPGRAPQPGQLPAGLSPSAGTAAATSPAASAGSYRFTLATAQAQAAAGARIAITGRVTTGGAAAAGVRVRLAERLAGSDRWQIVAAGTTGPRGRFVLTTPPLTASAVFRVVAPDGSYSRPARVTVADGG